MGWWIRMDKKRGGGGAGIKTNGLWSFFRVVNLEENFLIKFTWFIPILGSTAGRVLPRCWGVEWFPYFPRLQIDFVGQGASIVYFGGHRHNVDQRSVKSISPHASWLSGGGGGHRRTWLFLNNSLFSWGGFSWTNHGYVKGLYYTNYGHHLHITSINNTHWDFWLVSVPFPS